MWRECSSSRLGVFGTERRHICPCRYRLELCIKKFMSVLVWSPLRVILILSHTHIGLPQRFNFNFPISIPATFIWESPWGSYSGAPTSAKCAWIRAPYSENMVNLFSFGCHVIDRTSVRTYVRVYGLYGWGGGDYQKEGRDVSGVS